MITAEKTIERIIQCGTVIITTLLSFVVKPPAIYEESNATIHYNNLYVFIIGIICVIIYSNVNISNYKILKISIILPSFIILIIGYGLLQDHYSRLCKIDLDKEERFVIAYSENFKSQRTKMIYDSWKKNDVNREELAISETLRANDCNPSNIWKKTTIYPIFVGFFVYYIILAIVLVLLIYLASHKLVNIPI